MKDLKIQEKATTYQLKKSKKIKELNNVLTSQVKDKKVCVFTTNNQLLDIQTNEVG